MQEIKWYTCKQKKGDEIYVVKRPRQYVPPRDGKRGYYRSVPGAKYLGKLDPETGKIIRTQSGSKRVAERVVQISPKIYITDTVEKALRKVLPASAVTSDFDVLTEIAVRLMARWVGADLPQIDDLESNYTALLEIGSKVGSSGVTHPRPTESERSDYWTMRDTALFVVKAAGRGEGDNAPVAVKQDTVVSSFSTSKNHAVPTKLMIDIGSSTRGVPAPDKRGRWFNEVAPSEFGKPQRDKSIAPVVWRVEHKPLLSALPIIAPDETPGKHIMETAKLMKCGIGLAVKEAESILYSYKTTVGRAGRETDQQDRTKLVQGVSVALYALLVALEAMAKYVGRKSGEIGVAELVVVLSRMWTVEYDDGGEDVVAGCEGELLLKKMTQ